MNPTVISNTFIGIMYGFLGLMVFMWPQAFAPLHDRKAFTFRELLLSGMCWAYRGVLVLLVAIFGLCLWLYMDVYAFHILFAISFWFEGFLEAHHVDKDTALFWSMMLMAFLYMAPVLGFAFYWRRPRALE